jgi:hypothetical protein
MTNKVFISWSGHRSKALANTLREWLPNVIQFVDPWMSAEDIDKGARWSSDIATQLAEAKVGLICLTTENLESPWVLFEAGALSRTLQKTFVCPYLLDVDPADIRGPLVQFQVTMATKEDTNRLVHTINGAMLSSPLSDERLNAAFEVWWPAFEKSLRKITDECGQAQRSTPRRSDRELIEEMLELVRGLERAQRTKERRSGRRDWDGK